ncbi:MAG: CDP-glycerol glycerophosphotransferase family protein [Clostridiales bacterium]|nr:CDP-glycerol glycerophosphotransferase family protein [Clostridiales bacterium]
MRSILYKAYALSFNFFSRFPLKENRVALLSPHMAKFTDSLGEVENEFKRRGGFETVRISGADIKPERPTGAIDAVKKCCRMISFFTRGAKKLAGSKYVFLNDNFMPMSELKFNKKTVITQLWHAEGAFKKFGLDLCLPEDVRERVKKGNSRLDYVVCTSENLRPIYASAFGVPVEKVVALGSPRADKYVRSFKENSFDKDAFKQKFFNCADKKIVLYAPTFRDDADDNKKILDHFDFKKFSAELGEKYIVVLRLHPQIHGGISVPENVFDMTGYDNIDDLIQASDVLVTDYSSVCMDFSLLNKPTVFYAYDLDKFGAERQFYFDYESYVPGSVAKTFDELLTAIKNLEPDEEKIKKFTEINFGINDGKAAERICSLALKTK